jgi:carbonic anhydrase/acetyltransferase-like protein (isoleucine patch superfamily)
MPDYTPVNNASAQTFTSTASAAITGGQVLDATGNNTVGPSAGALHPVGVALHDAPSGGRVSVAMISSVIHECVIKNTVVIAAGAPIIPASAAAGQIDTGTLATVAAAGTLIGVCLSGGTGNAGGTVKARFIGIG